MDQWSSAPLPKSRNCHVCGDRPIDLSPGNAEQVMTICPSCIQRQGRDGIWIVEVYVCHENHAHQTGRRFLVPSRASVVAVISRTRPEAPLAADQTIVLAQSDNFETLRRCLEPTSAGQTIH